MERKQETIYCRAYLLFYNNFYFISFYASVSSSLYHFFDKKKLRGRSRGPPTAPAMAQMAQGVIRSWREYRGSKQ